MRTKALALAAVGLAATAVITACDNSIPTENPRNRGSAKGPEVHVGVILPGTANARRWSTHDPMYFQEAFDAAGIRAEIANAHGDPENFQRIGKP